MPGRPYMTTTYYVSGLDDRWDWDSYSIVVSPNGNGYYYNWSLGKPGETLTAKPEYECCTYTGRSPVCGY